MNNLNYGYPSSNNSSFSSFSSQYSSTPSNTRFQRPRFAYSGPPSYPRPRSSASKPNPDMYSASLPQTDYTTPLRASDNTQNTDPYHDTTVRDYSHGYTDSMRNNYGDSTMHLSDSSTMNSSMDFNNTLSNSSAYYTGNESFYQSPQKQLLSNYGSESSSFGLANRGGHSSYGVDSDRQSAYFHTNVASSLPSTDITGQVSSFDTNLRGLTGSYGTSSRGKGVASFDAGSYGTSYRGKTGTRTFGSNRGNFRGRFQKKNPPFKSDKSNDPSMASKWNCPICSIDFTSQIPLEMHLRGAKHAKKLKTQSALHTILAQTSQIKEIEKPDGKKLCCEVCNIIANSSLQLQMHLDGTKHKAKLQQLLDPKDETKEDSGNASEVTGKVAEVNGRSNGGVIRPAPSDFGEPQPLKMAKFSCDICGIIVNSDTQLQQHLTSKKHQAKVEGKPIIKKKKAPKQDKEHQPLSMQPEDNFTIGPAMPEVTNVVGVKTLSSSFVQGGTLQ